MNCAVHVDRPAVQPCDRCGTFSCAECLVAVGMQYLCAACRTRVGELEWDRRKELGLFKAWWLTSRRMIVSPLRTLDAIAPDGTIVESTIYATVCTLVGFVPTLLLYALVLGGMLAFGASKGDAKIGLLGGTGIGVAALLFYLVMLVGFSIATVLLNAALELLVLRLAGKQGSYSVSVRAHALSMAAYAIGVIPFCSIYVFPIWALVLRAFAIHKLQRTTPGMGVAAALIPLGLCCGLVGGLYAVGIGIAMAMR